MSRNPDLVQEARVSEERIPRKSNDRRQQRDNSDSQLIVTTRFLEGLQRLSAEQQLPDWVRKALPDSQFRYRNEREDCLKGSTMNFPKYDGTKDPVSWFSRCKKYFALHKIREHSRVPLASFHLEEDAQIWFDTMQNDQLIENWQELKEAMNHQFGPTDYDDFDGD